MSFAQDDFFLAPFAFLWLLVFMIGCMVAYLVIPEDWPEERKKKWVEMFGKAAIVLCVVAAAGFVIFLTTRPQPPPVCTVSETPIRSLSLGKRTEGSFLVGTGSIQDVLYYFVYTKSGNGWVLGKYYAERWVLVESNSTPALVVTDCFRVIVGESRTLEIRIPEGTIVEAYSVSTESMALRPSDKADTGELSG